MRVPLAAGLGAAALALATLALSAGIGDGAGRETATSAALPQASAPMDKSSGHALYVRMGCGSCHTLAAAGSKGEIGPNLDERLPGHTRESLIARITASSSEADNFSVMPTNFASRMDAGELSRLVDFLLASR